MNYLVWLEARERGLVFLEKLSKAICSKLNWFHRVQVWLWNNKLNFESGVVWAERKQSSMPNTTRNRRMERYLGVPRVWAERFGRNGRWWQRGRVRSGMNLRLQNSRQFLAWTIPLQNLADTHKESRLSLFLRVFGTDFWSKYEA
jgi:hypothetical protein